MRKKFGLLLLGFSVISFLSSMYFLAAGGNSAGGPLLITCFITLAFGVRGFDQMKGFSYTIWIFTAVTASMFYPQFFLFLQ